jgi:hypothetical protein
MKGVLVLGTETGVPTINDQKKNKLPRKPRQKLYPSRRDEPKWRTKRLDHVPTCTRLARRDVSTTFRLAWGSLNGTPRPPRNLRLARPWVEPIDPSHSPTLRQKSEHLIQPPTTSYPHGYIGNQHGSSTDVKSHFLLPIPGWAVKTCHCTCHTGHYSATNHPRGRIRRVPYPVILGTRPYPFTVDPPRPVLDLASTNRRSKQECKACTIQDPESFRRLILYVVMVSRDSRPFSGYVTLRCYEMHFLHSNHIASHS